MPAASGFRGRTNKTANKMGQKKAWAMMYSPTGMKLAFK